ncbi:unnamed protein product [Acanthoscelides obtectus]|uniref:Major facilitator superfamily associated domain-containing protein n=1 Tax=Acanthoscelides obtectus TaxID=200917 RepID=A0A9P0KC21_ACAOB|nr:unnamed protein product [Acanthoscelides obtectus]CAK1655427.1 Major facilitator superfamily domain-containing protein 6 [Acanthoscelides obtectus]
MMGLQINKKLLPMKFHYFLYNAGTGPVVAYLSSYARQLGFSSVVVGLIYTILPVSGMLAKPLFGSIADKFHCHKSLFLVNQLVTAVAFLAIFYSPKIELDHSVDFSCQSDVLALSTYMDGKLDKCTLEQIQKDETIKQCQINCKVDTNLTSLLCHEWDFPQYCFPPYPESLPFIAHVPKSKMSVTQKKDGSIISFGFSNITLNNKTITQPKCMDSSMFTTCVLECDDYDIMQMVTKPSISDSDVYSLYQFWFFLAFMVLMWVSMAITVSIGDAICFELLGDQPGKYGYQRLFGSLGWGFVAAIAGVLIDMFSKGKVEKDYSVAFYMGATFLVLDFVISSRVQHKQTKMSSNILRDIGKWLLDARIVVFLIWCVAVGMCTGLIWNFLYWLLEDLAASKGCDARAHIKTLQGLVQAVQCLGGEVPFLFLSGRILKKIGHENTMSLILLGLGCRLVLHSLVTNPWLTLPVELFNGLTFGLSFACMASYASIVAPPGTEATVQGMVGAVFEGIGVSLGSTVAGLSYRSYGGSLTFRYFGFSSFILCIIHVAAQYIIKVRGNRSFIG